MNHIVFVWHAYGHIDHCRMYAWRAYAYIDHYCMNAWRLHGNIDHYRMYAWRVYWYGHIDHAWTVIVLIWRVYGWYIDLHQVLRNGGKLKIAEVASRFVFEDQKINQSQGMQRFADAVEALGFEYVSHSSKHTYFVLLEFKKSRKKGEGYVFVFTCACVSECMCLCLRVRV
jgi:hypothetical protein